MNNQLTGGQYKQMLLHGAAAITAKKQPLNDLNVFPVPDGDTGTNMSMTIGAAVTELNKIDPTTIDQAAACTASALLRGARGNSGVILSLLFRGFAKGLKGCETADAATFATAMQEGVSAAYKAVMKPAEGTVLTVSRLASKAAVDAAAEGADIQGVLEAAIAQGHITLAETTDMNPVLKKAGVVDAGGQGYLYIIEGMLAHLNGEPMPEMTTVTDDEEEESTNTFDQFATEDITFQYCTEFIVQRENTKDPATLQDWLMDKGDSLVLVDDEEIIKVHIHTNNPGMVLEKAMTFGSFVTLKVENMKLQHSQITSETAPAAPAAPAELAPATPEKPYGFMAVCAGDGLAALFTDLGCDHVVSGGQTMNPSTESLLAGIDRVGAETVFILPNNSNIIMAAQQCDAISDKNIVVIPSKSVPQGITAMMNVDFEAPSAEDITAVMNESLSSVTTAQITYAARDSDFDGFDIKEGNYLALKENKLFGSDADLDTLVRQLAEEANTLDASFISVYYGEDVTEEQATATGALIQELCPDAELAILAGNQPVYYYIISME
ncbi:DAK2 domain-containing protein [Bengtsoniella intestinalis]|uniref:DAK2 domain-containing protein n=1 Tax=Bengtsoniella intestinalis TaxID=3073143 RepID=UPI00391EFE86